MTSKTVGPNRHRLALLLTVSLAACASPSTIPKVQTPADQLDLVGRWQDSIGVDVADGTNGILTLSAFSASTSCSEEDSTVFVDLAWPVGNRVNQDSPSSSRDHYAYVRDPHGTYWTNDQPDLDTDLPAAARASGLRRAGNELYAKPSDSSAIWLQRPDGHIERWPQQKQGTGCA